SPSAASGRALRTSYVGLAKLGPASYSGRQKWSAIATAITTAALHAARTRAGTCGASKASRASAAIAAILGQEIRRQIADLTAAGRARNNAGRPRISQAIQADARTLPPCLATRWATAASAAAATMIPPTMIG